MGSNKGTSCHIQIKGEGKSRSEEIDLFPFVIGRGDDADIKILASGISRLHISVSLKEGSLWIEDLGSANGTFINDKKLSPKTPVICRPGDAIRLGLNNDILTFDLVEEKGPEHHEVVLPPLPKHIPESKEPLRVEVKVPAKPPAIRPPVPAPAPVAVAPKPKQVAEEIKPLEGTIVDPNYQSAALAAVAAKNAASAAALSKEQLEEAKAAALRIKITAETEAAKILQMAKEMAHDELSKAREEASQIVSKATDQAYRLQREGETEATKMRQAMQDTISKVHAETEEKVETNLKEARLSATTIKATAQTEADGIISKAYQKALEIKEKGEEDLKAHQKIEKKKGSEIVDRAQKEADKVLEEAHSASIKIRENIDKEIETIKARVEKEALKNGDDLVKAATVEAEKRKKEALKTAQKISDEVLRSERASHLNTFEKENKNLADTLLAAQTSLKKLEEEKGRLHDYIDEHKKKEAKLTRDFEERKTKLTREYDELKSKTVKANDESQAILTQEHEHFKAQLVKERDEFKNQIDKEKNKVASLITEEEKMLREKAKAEFYLQRESLEAEFAKSRISEISKALETYIIPRIKEGLNWEEIPKSLGNFSGDLRDIVKKVMNGDYSETVADTAMDTSLNHNTSSRRAKTLLFMTLGGGTAVLAFMAYTSLQDPASALRKPASQIFSKFQKPVPPPLVTSLEYKGSYTDNILYTKDYVALKLNPKDHEVWKTEIDNFFTNNLGLEKSKAEKFVDMEFELVHQLAGVRSGIKAENKKESIQKMATLEKLSVDQFIDVLGSQANYNAFRDFEKNYIERNRTPANQN
jgi:pSer/pThr/pTyr-binding forkhead associated (FHA) protein